MIGGEMRVLLGNLLLAVLLVLLGAILPAGGYAGVSVELKGFHLERTDKGFLVKGSVVGSGLNTPIPESDGVEVYAEIKMGPGARYPKLSQYYNIAAGCEQIAGKCLTKAEKEGVNIKSIRIATVALRPREVWLRYGGLGNWEKKAPDRVEKPFEGYIPLEYAGKEVRIRVTLTHVIGGPYAAWPGISYYHTTRKVVLSGSGVPNPNGPPIGPGPGPDNADLNKIIELKKELGRCHNMVRAIGRHIAKLKERKSAVDQKVMATHAGMGATGYEGIIEDIQTLQQLHRAGANYGIVLQTLDPIRESNSLRQWIEADQEGLSQKEAECRRLEERIRSLERRGR